MTLNPKEKWRVVELKKYLKIGEIRIAWKTKIWTLEFRKLPLRIGILEIKFERNWNLEDYLRIGVLKIKFKN